MMTMVLTEPPLVEPITLAEAKAHMRLETDDEDTLVADLITAARRHLEHETGLALISQTWRLFLDDWPESGIVALPRHPIQMVENVTTYNGDGVASEASLTGSVLDRAGRPARLKLAARPSVGQSLNGIEIDFTAGFGDTATDVPDTLKRAILTHVAAMYELRGLPAESQPATVPPGYDRLIAPYRRVSL